VIYDGDVYSIPNDGGWTVTYKIADVEAFNEHQSLSCTSNLFFAKWADLDAVHRAFLEVLLQRPSARHELVTAVLESENSWSNKYRVVTGESMSGQEEVLFHLGGEPINLPVGRLARVRYAPMATEFRSTAK
jgi:hypothetical protein